MSFNPDSYDESSLIVRFRDDALCSEAQCSGITQFGLLQGSQLGMSYDIVSGLTQIRLNDGVDFESVLDEYRRHPDVLYAEPDYQLQIAATPDDTRFSELWGMNNEGQTGGLPDADVDALNAWDVTTGSHRTVVAVIDTGVDYTHPDLARNIWINQGEIPTAATAQLVDVDSDGLYTFVDLNDAANAGVVADLNSNGYIDGADILPVWSDGVDDDGNLHVDDLIGYDIIEDDNAPMDDQGHGTHVAGTIGAHGNNALGVAGLNWQVQIMPLKFLDSTGYGTGSDAILSLNYAVQNGAAISNNSYGGDPFSQAFSDAITAAEAANHIFVAAAGNGNVIGLGLDNDAEPYYPASYNHDNIIAVAATDHTDQLAIFSNYGASTVDLAAPGVNILSTTPGGGYGLSSGTSMAAPHVAGVAALVHDLHQDDPNWTFREVIDQVLNTVDTVGALGGFTVTGGRLNAATALGNPEPPPPPGSLPIDENFDDGVANFFRPQIGVWSVSGGEYNVTPSQDNDSQPAVVTLNLDAPVPPDLDMRATINAAPESDGFFGLIPGNLSNAYVVFDYQDATDFKFAGADVQGDRWVIGHRTGSTWVSDATLSQTIDHSTDYGLRVVVQDGTDVGLYVDGALLLSHNFADSIVGGDVGLGTRNGVANYDDVLFRELDHVEVSLDGSLIADGSTGIGFGETMQGLSHVRTFTVTNWRSDDLTLVDLEVTPGSGYAIASNFADPVLSQGESTTFQLQMDGSTVGQFSTDVTITTDSLTEGPFTFNVVGDVTTTAMIDNGDAGFSTAGPDWKSATGEGTENDIHYSKLGNGSDIATWDFAVGPGEYRVAAAWSVLPNRATDAPYTIYDGSDPRASIDINQEVAPDSFTADDVTWEILGDVTVVSNSLKVELTDDANEYVIADAIRIERLSGLPSGPEIEVTMDGVELIDGSGSIHLQTEVIGVAPTKSITVTNWGIQDLVLSNLAATPGADFSAGPFASTTLGTGESTTFDVALTASSTGSYAGQVTFSTNDSDESQYDLIVTGDVTASVVMDDGDIGFTTTGPDWRTAAGQGFGNDITYSKSGSGGDVATWQFSVGPGEYSVAANWTTHANRATNAPYTVFDGSTSRGTVFVNQEIAPDDFNEHGTDWESLGDFVVVGDTLVVQLTDNANEYVIADGIRIERIGDLNLSPEISVSIAGNELESNVDTFDFGETLAGISVTQTVSVTNWGTQPLLLDNLTVSPSAAFQVTSPLGSSTVGMGESTSFEIAFDVGTAGTYNAVVSLGTNDSDEDPFTFGLVGSAVSTSIIDNGDVGFATSGSDWKTASGIGAENDMHYSKLGTGQDVATWTFDVAPGEYDVAVSWPEHPNRATNAPFEILDGSVSRGTTLVNQENAPSEFQDQDITWDSLGRFVVTGNSLVVKLTDDANEYVIADAVRVERVGDVLIDPEISVSLGGVEIDAGTGSVNLGSTLVGKPLVTTFSVRNLGLQDLNLGSLTLSGSPEFSISQGLGDTVLGTGETTSFEIAWLPTAEGTLSADVTLTSNDADESPYQFSVSGSGIKTTVIDNGDPGFVAVGDWTDYTGEGAQNDMHYKNAGDGSDVASWSLDVAPGEYRVAASWPAASNRATNTPFTIYDGNTSRGTVRINQKNVPDDFNDGGLGWEELGTFIIVGDTLAVEMSDDANEYVIADSIRVERVGDLLAEPEVDVTLSGVDVPDNGGPITFATETLGLAPTKTFTVTNSGLQDLVLGPVTVTDNAGFSVSQPLGSTTLAIGESTTFQVALSEPTAGNFNATVSFATNDADESLYDFSVQGVVVDSQILDNGDSGFTTSGSDWKTSTDEGAENDMHYSKPGTGSDQAQWSFQVGPGEYQIAATWPAAVNRATNTPFTIWDGVSPRGTVEVNQENAPTHFNDAGVGWHILGTFKIVSNSLTVELTDAANEYVIADGIRIQRIADLPATPFIDVAFGGSLLTQYGATVDFGETMLQVPLSKSFTVTNLGQQDLSLSNLDVTPASAFAISSSFGASMLATGESTTFDVTLNSSAAGETSADVSFDTNDPDDAPFSFTVQGDVVATQIIDNGDAGFSTSGNDWKVATGEGAQDDMHYSKSGTGGDVATWTFSVPAGDYQISATWPATSNRANDTPFTILDGSLPVGSVTVDQEIIPDDFMDAGVGWKLLGSYTISGNTLVVRMSDDANEYVIADSIRIERIQSMAAVAAAVETQHPVPDSIDEAIRQPGLASHDEVPRAVVELFADHELSTRSDGEEPNESVADPTDFDEGLLKLLSENDGGLT